MGRWVRGSKGNSRQGGTQSKGRIFVNGRWGNPLNWGNTKQGEEETKGRRVTPPRKKTAPKADPVAGGRNQKAPTRVNQCGFSIRDGNWGAGPRSAQKPKTKKKKTQKKKKKQTEVGKHTFAKKKHFGKKRGVSKSDRGKSFTIWFPKEWSFAKREQRA